MPSTHDTLDHDHRHIVLTARGLIRDPGDQRGRRSGTQGRSGRRAEPISRSQYHCSAQDCRGRRCLEPHAVNAGETIPVSWSLRITLAVLLVIAMAEVWVLWMV